MNLILDIAWTHVRSRVRQTGFAVAGVATGVGFSIMMASLMQGSQDDFTERLVNTLPHITVTDERRKPPPQPAEQLFASAEIHGLTPEARRPGIKNPLATMAALEAWVPGGDRAIGEGAGDHPLCQSRRVHDGDGHRSAARGERVGAAQADARRHAHRALSRHQCHRPRRPAVGKDRRPHRRQYHAADQSGRPHHAPRSSASSTPASASKTKARPMC